MPAKLRNLVINRVDLVDKGANPMAHVVLVKRDVADKADLRPAHDRTASNDSKRKKKTRQNMAKNELYKRLLEFVKALPAPAGDGQEGDGQAASSTDGAEGQLPEAHINYLHGLHKHLGDMIHHAASADGTHDHLPSDHPIHKIKDLHKALGATLEAYGTQPGAADNPEGEFEENVPDEGGVPTGDESLARNPKDRNELTKRFSELEKRATAAEKRAESAEKIAKQAVADRAKEKMTAELKKFVGVAIDPVKDADALLALQLEKPETYKRVMEIVGAADATIKTSKMFSEVGTGRVGESNAWAQIEAEAASLVSKDAKLTKAKAIDRVMKVRTDLVRQHLDETRSQA